MYGRGKFTSKRDGMSRAKRRHVCLDCCYHQPETWKACPQCGSPNRQYFMSASEHRRGMLLLTLQKHGKINRLRFQPRYDLIVNSQKIGVYTADVEYYEDGALVVEDTKPKNFMDPFAVHKIKHFEAQYGLTVRIPQRKSGNRAKTTDRTFI
jgi:RNA polymerase subunit RPABC4/transcription elongation factor Spt4